MYTLMEDKWEYSALDSNLTLKQARARLREIARNVGSRLVSKSLNEIVISGVAFDRRLWIKRIR